MVPRAVGIVEVRAQWWCKEGRFGNGAEQDRRCIVSEMDQEEFVSELRDASPT